MRPIATDVARSVVCVFGTRVSCAKTAEPIEMPFEGVDLSEFKESRIR